MNSAASPIVIVGASLAGLTLALACASRGVPVRVVERAVRRPHGGDSLSVDLAALAIATGHDPRAQPLLSVVPAYRDRHLVTWPALYGWLRGNVETSPGIVLEEGKVVTAVTSDGLGAQLSFADGTQMAADAVIGADGYHSVVRRAIAPEAPFARYAGYIVWRGLVEERNLSRPVPWSSNNGLWIDFVDGYRLVAAVLPGRDGSLEVGRRQVTFAWFDVHREELLRRTGRLTADGFIVGTLGRGSIDADLRSDLHSRVDDLWPNGWAEAVKMGLQSPDALSGAPIAEYKPERLNEGALAIVGHAAHVVSPMTGRGFATGVEDAIVLADLLMRRDRNERVADVLTRYGEARLPFIRGLVAHSERISRDYVRFAAAATLS
jgi:2-polyprenyl-6-methoxyphenol hydroxylase-like FAD-dependent oxidoreductase